MIPEINGIPLAHRKGLWFADVPSKSYGTLEAVLDGSKEAPDAMQAYAELGVHELVVNLGGQKPDQVDKRLPQIGSLVKMAA